MENKAGTVTKEKEGFKVVFERILSHNIQRVWDAITDPEQLRIWFTDVEMELKPQSPMRIIFRDSAKSVTNGKVIEVNPPHRFVWSWETELAVWELTELDKNRTRLLFTYSKMEDRYAVGAAGGFETVLGRLQAFLAGDKTVYPFGTEEFDPEQIAKRESYGAKVYDAFPELEKYHPVKLERVFNAPAQKIWQALTDNEQTKLWYFDFHGSFKPVAGQVFEWNGGEPGGKQWLHRGKVLEVTENRLLVHSWEFPGYSGEARLTWELEKVDENNTRLKLLFEFITPFDGKEEALRRKNFAEGWNYFFNQGLAEFLEKQA